MQLRLMEWHKISAIMKLPVLFLFSQVLLFAFPDRVSAQTDCVNGRAGEFSCKNIDLLSHMSLSELGDMGRAQDNWGWKDPQTGRYYAIVSAGHQ